jgi:hypothetical protein
MVEVDLAGKATFYGPNHATLVGAQPRGLYLAVMLTMDDPPATLQRVRGIAVMAVAHWLQKNIVEI